jgi:hypothetical protein
MASNEYGYIGKHATISSAGKSGVFSVNDQKVIDDDGLWTTEGLTEDLVFWIDASLSGSYSGSGGNVYDISDTGTTGSFGGTNTLYSSEGGGSFNFNGTGGITFTNSTALNINNKSIVIWIKTNNTSQNGFWFEKGNVNTQYSFFQEGGVITWRTYDTASNGDLDVTTSSHMNTSTWYMMTAWYDGSNKRIYKDGANLIGSQTGNSYDGASNNQGIYVGLHGGNGYKFSGRIAYIKVFSKALSSTEMNFEYNATKARFGK